MKIRHLPLLALAAFPALALAADDWQAGQEQRRAESEQRRLEAQGRRDMENRERLQAEALRGQEEAIRRMEATQARLEANSQRLAQQSADQANNYNSPRYIYVAPVAPAMPNFAPLSERLKDYFGAASGVLVVSAGPGAPFGLQDGDVVISIDGRIPADGPHAVRILHSYQPGERIRLRVQRDGRAMDIDTMAPGPRGN